MISAAAPRPIEVDEAFDRLGRTLDVIAVPATPATAAPAPIAVRAPRPNDPSDIPSEHSVQVTVVPAADGRAEVSASATVPVDARARIYFFFGDFPANADGERRGLDRIGG